MPVLTQHSQDGTFLRSKSLGGGSRFGTPVAGGDSMRNCTWWPAQSDNGGLLQNVSHAAENVKMKVSWKSLECQGVPSTGASEERIFSLSSAKGEIVGAGQHELLTFPSCWGAQVCPKRFWCTSVLKLTIIQPKHILFSVCLSWNYTHVLSLLRALETSILYSPLVGRSSSRWNNGLLYLRQRLFAERRGGPAYWKCIKANSPPINPASEIFPVKLRVHWLDPGILSLVTVVPNQHRSCL